MVYSPSDLMMDLNLVTHLLVMHNEPIYRGEKAFKSV
jgi:hypothetical protein